MLIREYSHLKEELKGTYVGVGTLEQNRLVALLPTFHQEDSVMNTSFPYHFWCFGKIQKRN